MCWSAVPCLSLTVQNGTHTTMFMVTKFFTKTFIEEINACIINQKARNMCLNTFMNIFLLTTVHYISKVYIFTNTEHFYRCIYVDCRQCDVWSSYQLSLQLQLLWGSFHAHYIKDLNVFNRVSKEHCKSLQEWACFSPHTKSACTSMAPAATKLQAASAATTIHHGFPTMLAS